MKNTILATSLGVLLSLSAHAQEVDLRRDALRSGLYVSPLFQHVAVDSNRGTDNGQGYGLALGYRGQFAAVELLGATVDLDRNDTGSASLDSVGLNMLLAPLVAWPVLRDTHLLLGYAYNERQNHPGFAEDEQTYFLDVGLAYLPSFRLLGVDMALRLEYLIRQDTQQPVFPESAPRAFDDEVFRLGVQVPLSARPEPPAPPEPEVVEIVTVDGDADGVPDAQDQCPATSPRVEVDAEGCALPPPAVCDVGGLIWELDGCSVGQTFVLEGVRFASNSAALSPEAISELNPAVYGLLEHPQFGVQISGHTDDVGSAAYNQALSQRRAAAVRQYLIASGVAAAAIEAVGYGEDRPRESNDSEWGRSRNRRVELTLIAGQPSEGSSND